MPHCKSLSGKAPDRSSRWRDCLQSVTRSLCQGCNEPPICAAGRSLLHIALTLPSWLICAMESWLCVPVAEDQEGDADQNRCEHHEDAGLDALECPEAAGRLEGHRGPVAVGGQAR